MIQTTVDTRVRMRKIAALGLAAGLLLTGCGRDNPVSSGAETGKAIAGRCRHRHDQCVGTGRRSELLPEFVKEFEAANPGVKVEVTAIPWDAAHNKYQTAIAGGHDPRHRADGHDLDGLTSLMPSIRRPPSSTTPGFLPGSVKSTEVGGTSRGCAVVRRHPGPLLPHGSRRAGRLHRIPRPTGTSLKAMAKAMQAQAGAKWGDPAAGWRCRLFPGMLPFRWSAGAELINEDNTQWTLDTPEWVEAHDVLPELLHRRDRQPEPRPPGRAPAEAAFVDGYGSDVDRRARADRAARQGRWSRFRGQVRGGDGPQEQVSDRRSSAARTWRSSRTARTGTRPGSWRSGSPSRRSRSSGTRHQEPALRGERLEGPGVWPMTRSSPSSVSSSRTPTPRRTCPPGPRSPAAADTAAGADRQGRKGPGRRR